MKAILLAGLASLAACGPIAASGQPPGIPGNEQQPTVQGAHGSRGRRA